MRKKLTVALLGLVMSGLIAGTVLAEDVYVTKYGKKYHKAESRFIKGKDVQKLSREEAEEKGYKPSSDFLEEITDAAGSQLEKK